MAATIKAPVLVPIAASSELELDADDILESSDLEEIDALDIDALEAAAAGIESFEVSAPPVAAAPTIATLVGGMESPFASHPPVAPPAPHTSPLPLDSIIVEPASEPALAAAPVIVATVPASAEKTLEMKDTAALVAAAAENIDGGPGQTEVLVRSAMPAALQRPSVALAATAPAWQNGRSVTANLGAAAQQARQQVTQRQVGPRPGSIAPVALDAAPAPAAVAYGSRASKPSSNGFLIGGGIVFAAVALIGFVGVGGYLASRALVAKSDAPALAAPAEAKPAMESNPAAQAPAETAAPVAAAPSTPSPIAEPSPTPSSAGVDVSSLPSAPAPAAAAPLVAAGTPRASSNSSNGGSSTSSGRSSSPSSQGGSSVRLATPSTSPNGGSTALPPPGAAAAPLPPPAAAPAPVAVVASTGVVRVDPSLRAVVVDGSYHRANDGAVTVTCGRHKVKAGMKEAQVVDVPCGGSVSL